METCPKYSEADKKWKVEHLEGGTIWLRKYKKDDDFEKLERELRDNDKLSQWEKNLLLKKIQLSIECDINLALLEAQGNPDRRNYRKAHWKIGTAIKYGLDVTSWLKAIDVLYPISFLRNESLRGFQRDVKEMTDYIEKPNSFAHMTVFRSGYRDSREAQMELVALGIPKEQTDIIREPIVRKFLWVYLNDALKEASLFMEWKSGLRWFVSNPVTEWRRDLNDALDAYRGINGNLSKEYQDIVKKINIILPEMLKIEMELEIWSMKRKIDTNPFGRPEK